MKTRLNTTNSKGTFNHYFTSSPCTATKPEELSIRVVIGNHWSKTYFRKPATRTIRSILNHVDTLYELPFDMEEIQVINWTTDSPFKGRFFRHEKFLKDLA